MRWETCPPPRWPSGLVVMGLGKEIRHEHDEEYQTRQQGHLEDGDPVKVTTTSKQLWCPHNKSLHLGMHGLVYSGQCGEIPLGKNEVNVRNSTTTR